MKQIKKAWTTKPIDWEELGQETMLAANEEASAIDVCRYHLHAYEQQVQPEIVRVTAETGQARAQAQALHLYLYDRPVPVDDASMLTYSLRVRIVLALCLLVAGACLAGNLTTFVLFGWGIVAALIAAIFITALPLGIGHLAYEKLLTGNKVLQSALILIIALLAFAGFYEFGQARRIVMDKAAAQSATNSYVDDDQGNGSADEATAQGISEARAKATLGGAAFLITVTAELALGYLVGLFVTLRTHKDYAAWRKLKAVLNEIGILSDQLAELRSRIEQAKTRCMAGLRRGQDRRNKRRVPYHQALVVLTICAFLRALPLYSQVLDHEEGILLDTSASIGSGNANRGLFQECVGSIKKLLASEPPNMRVWVATIASDSFGGTREIVKGWTPEVHGVFSDDLNRARGQLAMNFDTKSAVLAPKASGTDIFGGLWHMKSLFESVSRGSPNAPSKTVWILSDMMNETPEFPMPKLIEIGPERMFERVKANGLVVPLLRYEIRIYGASTAGLTPRSWATIRRFWEMYFVAAGARLVSYSTECDAQRSGD
jgi:hypothetical protein